MIEEELLKETKRRYPIGTKFRPAHVNVPDIFTVKGYYQIPSGHIQSNIVSVHIEEPEVWVPNVFYNGKWAEIDKESAIIAAEQNKKQIEIMAEADKYRVETQAAAQLEAKKKEAEGTKTVGLADAEVIQAKGTSEAEAKKLMELARVVAETTLAEKIGENKPYQEYLVELKKVEVSQVVGVAQYESIANAMGKAELKFLINSGDVHSGIGKFSDLFSAKGGSQLNGMLESLKQTDEGRNILAMLDKFKPESK